MDSQYKLLSELLLDQAAFITSPKTSLANYWGALPPCPPSVYGPAKMNATITECWQLLNFFKSTVELNLKSNEITLVLIYIGSGIDSLL